MALTFVTGLPCIAALRPAGHLRRARSASPRVALSAVLGAAAFALFDWRTVAAIGRIDPREFWIAIAATVGVIAVGVINAILVTVVLALGSLVRLTGRRSSASFPRCDRP